MNSNPKLSFYYFSLKMQNPGLFANSHPPQQQPGSAVRSIAELTVHPSFFSLSFFHLSLFPMKGRHRAGVAGTFDG